MSLSDSQNDSHISRQFPISATQEYIGKFTISDEDANEAGPSSKNSNATNQWCVCKLPHEKPPMFRCDNCNNWFHGKCIGLTISKFNLTKAKSAKNQWFCPDCVIPENCDISLESSNTQSQVTCISCGKHFKNIKGLKIHLSKIHHSDLPTNSGSNNIPVSTPPTNSVKCNDCGQHFNGPNGLRIHVSKAHPSIQRDIIANKYQTDEPDNSDNSTHKASIQKNKHIHEINNELESYRLALENLMASGECRQLDLDNIIDSLIKTLSKATEKLPGPKHPAVKFYRARKSKNIFSTNDRNYHQSKNPERQSKRDRNRRKEKYNYEVMQYNYYNRRKKCAQQIMNTNKLKQCNIPNETLFNSFRDRWETENNCIRPSYGNNIQNEHQSESQNYFDPIISCDEILSSIKGIKIDSSPGPDGILVRTIKCLKIAGVLSTLSTLMLNFNMVPSSFHEAYTILIYKSGDINNPNNWRPISICSILRRIIERVLDKRLRDYINLSSTQRGFSTSPGCHLNSSIVNGLLQQAKAMKKDMVIVFLDIMKAFDCIGHQHLLLSLESAALPESLKNLIWSLQQGNFTRILSNGNKTKQIYFKKGVLQGSPLSPILFNIAIDFVLRELSEHEISKHFGCSVTPDLDPISALGFADDTALVANSRTSAAELIWMAKHLFEQIGLSINENKSIAICLKKGILDETDLSLDSTTIIDSLKKDQIIKYLGVTFKEEIIFDEAGIINNLKLDLEKLIGSSLLHPDQKLSIMNQYIWPKLIYPLQTAPLNKISRHFLEDVDKLIRNAVKETIGLPNDTPTSMLYSSQKVKGLSIVRTSWEASIQSFNICEKLKAVNDPYISQIRNLDNEINTCLQTLSIDEKLLDVSSSDRKSVKRSSIIREILQKREFEKWCNYPTKGKGIALFDECPTINRWINNRNGLSSSEWVNYLKMVGNVAPVRAIPGRSLESNRCRHCDEIETLPHVLGFCQYGQTLRNSRHHRIRSAIANSLKQTGLTVYEEVSCISENGSNRRIDIIAIDSPSKIGYVIDPTVRFEINHSQPDDVNMEKQRIYEPCIPYLSTKYQLTSIEVIGLLIGARGTITSFLEKFRNRFKLPSSLRDQIVLIAIKGSAQILQHHLYST